MPVFECYTLDGLIVVLRPRVVVAGWWGREGVGEGGLRINLVTFTVLLVKTSYDSSSGALSCDANTIRGARLGAVLIRENCAFGRSNGLLLSSLTGGAAALSLSKARVSASTLTRLSVFPGLASISLSSGNCNPTFSFTGLPRRVAKVSLANGRVCSCSGLIDIMIRRGNSRAIAGLRRVAGLCLPRATGRGVRSLIHFCHRGGRTVATNAVSVGVASISNGLRACAALHSIPSTGLLACLRAGFTSLFGNSRVSLDGRLKLSRGAGRLLITPTSGIAGFRNVRFLIRGPC